jgi:hypothetical protein
LLLEGLNIYEAASLLMFMDISYRENRKRWPIYWITWYQDTDPRYDQTAPREMKKPRIYRIPGLSQWDEA